MFLTKQLACMWKFHNKCPSKTVSRDPFDENLKTTMQERSAYSLKDYVAGDVSFIPPIPRGPCPCSVRIYYF